MLNASSSIVVAIRSAMMLLMYQVQLSGRTEARRKLAANFPDAQGLPALT